MLRRLAGLACVVTLAHAGCVDPDSTGAGGGASATGSTAATGGASEGPPRPAGLVSHLAGSAADADVKPAGPALLLMGGGPDTGAALTWWTPYLAGGDVVVLRTASDGADAAETEALRATLGVDSVETLVVTTEALAESAYVTWALDHAEGIFLAEGDQATYVDAWKGSAVAAAIAAAWTRGAAIGGTGAGTSVLGQFVHAATQGAVSSDQALQNPYVKYVTMERDVFALPPLAGVIADPHFHERDRMGRLVTFLGRVLTDGWATRPIGVGVDEGTALGIDPAGAGLVLGAGAVYVLEPSAPPAVCAPQQPLQLAGVPYHVLHAGDRIGPAGWTTSVPARTVSAAGGALSPADPY